MVTLEEAMEEAQATMQSMIDEKANMYKVQVFLIGDFYEVVAAEKIENLKALHNAA